MLGSAVVLAGTALWGFWKPPKAEPGAVLSSGIMTLGLAVLLYLGYPWFTLGYWARLTVLALSTFSGLSQVFLAFRVSSRTGNPVLLTRTDWIRVLAAVVVGVVVPVLAMRAPGRDAVGIKSPFSTGVWYVAQGGGLSLLNHHMSVPAQRYSLDLVRLDEAGRSCSGPRSSLESYPAWGSQVLSPVSGVVVAVVDGLPDMPIGRRDVENPAGNHIVLETGDGTRILLAHLRHGSVKVLPGSRVEPGQVLAEVGNSGNTSEPHLHLQAMKITEGDDWMGVPIEIEGRVLHRGRLLQPER